ncbi:hypothetical protein HRR83_000287 [Exophiala dermatitidis]|uniref:Uncharacterized protein n=1 Tax=Exophiala dermatitidis TaxID=5970 RepID=A0AAN6IYM1_EXODE|nr:hypothetical protein HRR73_002823 [Exophiala dermatitidis]KAJ4524663.1 hypothetical protein HRR75_000253 [Exophiala dermatitidis]KAJ4527535.1 hypothetical protein HRR74_000289 [Exophiala dermatitidis]KAJ4531108.1 hypothetical protein HRR76_008785 [Exophiala dermatitidis]KAJ4549974.1 hypothetical protein HRR78_004785 [Exophiala dermatitidis]
MATATRAVVSTARTQQTGKNSILREESVNYGGIGREKGMPVPGIANAQGPRFAMLEPVKVGAGASKKDMPEGLGEESVSPGHKVEV